MSENKKTRCISKIKIRTIRTFRTISGLQNKKSIQSVHFGHPVNGSPIYQKKRLIV